VLKTQLHSKLNLSHLRCWQDSEDILTGDFFGTLDYLPRQPYLRDFLQCVELINDQKGCLELERVDWGDVAMSFWPRFLGQDDATEPDVVLASNRWVIVVEVKLGSSFGRSQPWREYQFGQQTARNRGLSGDAVHYVIVSLAMFNGAKVFDGLTAHQRAELEPRTLWFRWLDAVTLVDGWLRQSCTDEEQANKCTMRMLKDLLGALRRRRTLSFCGFSPPNRQPVHESRPPIFCPPLFHGFLCKESVECHLPPSIGFLARFHGFFREARPSIIPLESIWLRRFQGFVHSAGSNNAPTTSIFYSSRFKGFVNNALHCYVSPTMSGLHKAFFRETCSPVTRMESVWLRAFRGFVCSAKPTNAPMGAMLCLKGFGGFVNVAPRCVASTTMTGLHKKETLKR
jgi:hypothetical protein